MEASASLGADNSSLPADRILFEHHREWDALAAIGGPDRRASGVVGVLDGFSCQDARCLTELSKVGRSVALVGGSACALKRRGSISSLGRRVYRKRGDLEWGTLSGKRRREINAACVKSARKSRVTAIDRPGKLS